VEKPRHKRSIGEAAASLVLAVMLVGAIGLGRAVQAAEATSVEYKIKAGYLLKFASFVEWPTNAFPSPATPIILGVLGKDPFGADLESTIGDKRVEGRALRIRRLDEGDDVTGCHILFISSSERKRLPQILDGLKNSCTLTVSEFDEFTQSGGMISFVRQENTIRFEINVEAARRAGLKLSSKLLQVAKLSEARRKN